MKLQSRYPIYVISKGRWKPHLALTARFLIRDRVDFKLVVEPQEADAYAEGFGSERLLVLPFSDQGVTPARNWVWEHAREAGAEWHWILDDNIRNVRRSYHGCRLECDARIAFHYIEEFIDRYENVAIAGMNYVMFGVPGSPVFVRNCHVYSNLLIRNDLPQRWRLPFNEDTDLCLQVLTDGWCTVSFNAFLVEKLTTMTMEGGNTELYKGNGRLEMALSLAREWPDEVKVVRRYRRPQHVVKWKKFTTPLRLKPGVDLEALRALGPVEDGIELHEVKPVESPRLLELKQRFEGAAPC
jgi:hypothetical protein